MGGIFSILDMRLMVVVKRKQKLFFFLVLEWGVFDYKSAR